MGKNYFLSDNNTFYIIFSIYNLWLTFYTTDTRIKQKSKM